MIYRVSTHEVLIDTNRRIVDAARESFPVTLLGAQVVVIAIQL